MQFGFSLNKKRVLVVMLLAACATSVLGAWVSDMLRMPAACALAPVSDFVKASTSAFKAAMAERETPALSASEAARLRKEVDQWRSEAWARARGELKWWREYRRIQKMRNAYAPSLRRCELIPAQVILGEALPYGQSQTFARGTIHGVEPGMRVIDVLTDRSKALPADDQMRAITGYARDTDKPVAGSVLVGWVEAAGSFTARVRLITDKRFKIRAWLQRVIDPENPRKVTAMTPEGPTEKILTPADSKLIYIQVILHGDGERGLITEDIQKSDNIRPGDWLWTTVSAKLPRSLRVGKVISVSESDRNPNFVVAKVAPIADLGALRDIYIVRSLVSQLPESRGGG
ncbi:MAG: rod shape-determining protein MreC [Phycisphaerae bacterium]|jgi:cell shape-determining protein MreC|nr:rod shape-determining protein MreC [Phycisphaerae bacterium]